MILDEIIENKLLEIEEAKKQLPLGSLIQQIDNAPPVADFFKAIYPNGQLRIIAEVKHASPSKGVFREDFDPIEIAKGYSSAGASAISVLTDKKYFKGNLDFLRNIKQHVTTPLLRKDFIVDPYQVYETRVYGADALLLIVAALEVGKLRDLLELTHALGLNAIVEVHDEDELDTALNVGSRIIGINNRDLRTFKVDLGVSSRLSKMIPPDKIAVAESGIRSHEDINKLRAQGVHVFLIGETFMRFPIPGEQLQNLIAACD